MKFTKMQGLGNDYVYVNCFEEKIENPSELAVKVSDRHFGIGSDGLILIRPSEVADFRMTMFNADGSESEMCGNGIRCVGKYVYDYGLTDKTEVSVETLAGIKYLKFLIKDGKVDMVTVNMGEPILKPELVPVVGEGDAVIDSPIEVDGKEYKMTCVSMGNPHSVVFVDDVDNFPLHEVGPLFEHHKAFPRRVNAEFCQVIDRTHARMRVWERGSGETWACGTGACAVAVAACENGFCKKGEDIKIKLKGGDLIINYTDETVYMTGNAEKVFEGEVEV